MLQRANRANGSGGTIPARREEACLVQSPSTGLPPERPKLCSWRCWSRGPIVCQTGQVTRGLLSPPRPRPSSSETHRGRRRQTRRVSADCPAPPASRELRFRPASLPGQGLWVRHVQRCCFNNPSLKSFHQCILIDQQTWVDETVALQPSVRQHTGKTLWSH